MESGKEEKGKGREGKRKRRSKDVGTGGGREERKLTERGGRGKR